MLKINSLQIVFIVLFLYTGHIAYFADLALLDSAKQWVGIGIYILPILLLMLAISSYRVGFLDIFLFFLIPITLALFTVTIGLQLFIIEQGTVLIDYLGLFGLNALKIIDWYYDILVVQGNLVGLNISRVWQIDFILLMILYTIISTIFTLIIWGVKVAK